jgi:hypothetical protein
MHRISSKTKYDMNVCISIHETSSKDHKEGDLQVASVELGGVIEIVNILY